MRSSKQRSRSKQNRNRSVGNIVNRVFDSSGPEGKVRGTPQQIIDKYNQLARDAQLSGDRVATENFQQHAEHYTRMLAEAMREQEARREAQEAQNRERQQQRQAANREDREAQPQSNAQPQPQPDMVEDQGSAPQPDLAPDPAPVEPVAATAPAKDPAPSDVIEVVEASSEDTGLVETPESKPAPKPRTRRPRKKPAAATPAADPDSGTAEAAE